MINKGISKALRYTGIGSLDTVFGFFFGFIRGYIICVMYFPQYILFIITINGQLNWINLTPFHT